MVLTFVQENEIRKYLKIFKSKKNFTFIFDFNFFNLKNEIEKLNKERNKEMMGVRINI